MRIFKIRFSRKWSLSSDSTERDRYRYQRHAAGNSLSKIGFANYHDPWWNRRLAYGTRVPEACRRLLARVREELQDVLRSMNETDTMETGSFCDFREENRTLVEYILEANSLNQRVSRFLIINANRLPSESHEIRRCMHCALDYVFVSRRLRISSIERSRRRVISYVAESKNPRTVDWSYWSSNKIGKLFARVEEKETQAFRSPRVQTSVLYNTGGIWRGVSWFEKPNGGVPLFPEDHLYRRANPATPATLSRLILFYSFPNTRRAPTRELRGSKWNYRP